MAHAQTNNVHEEHKRVSFGGEKQMIVYDDGLIDDYSLQHATKHNTSFTDSDAPPNKVKVTSENQEIPRPISPPAQIEDLNPATSITSPPLPSLVKRMENESVENPFRPTETLYHEVDPIVEAYRQRPFPPSPSNSPVPPHLQPSSPLNHGYRYHEENSSTKFTNDISYESSAATPSKPNKSSSSKKSNGRNSRTSSLAEARTPASHTPLISSNEVVMSGELLPPPSKAEIVHIDEKKKRCACCSLQ